MVLSRYGSLLDEPLGDVSSYSLDSLDSPRPRTMPGSSRYGSLLREVEEPSLDTPVPPRPASEQPTTGLGDFLHKLTYPLTLPKRAMDYVVREAANLTNEYGNRLPETATTGQLARAAAGLNPTDQGQGYAERLGGKALEFGTDLLTDPLMFGMGALPKSVGRGAAAAFAPSMALSAVEEGKHAADLYREQGLSPEMAEATLGAGLSGAFAYGAGRHALESPVVPVAPRVPPLTREAWQAKRIPQSLDEMPLPQEAIRQPEIWQGDAPVVPEMLKSPEEVRLDMLSLEGVPDVSTLDRPEMMVPEPARRAQEAADAQLLADVEAQRVAKQQQSAADAELLDRVWKEKGLDQPVAPEVETPLPEPLPMIRTPEEVRLDQLKAAGRTEVFDQPDVKPFDHASTVAELDKQYGGRFNLPLVEADVAGRGGSFAEARKVYDELNKREEGQQWLGKYKDIPPPENLKSEPPDTGPGVKVKQWTRLIDPESGAPQIVTWFEAPDGSVQLAGGITRFDNAAHFFAHGRSLGEYDSPTTMRPAYALMEREGWPKPAKGSTSGSYDARFSSLDPKGLADYTSSHEQSRARSGGLAGEEGRAATGEQGRVPPEGENLPGDGRKGTSPSTGDESQNPKLGISEQLTPAELAAIQSGMGKGYRRPSDIDEVFGTVEKAREFAAQQKGVGETTRARIKAEREAKLASEEKAVPEEVGESTTAWTARDIPDAEADSALQSAAEALRNGKKKSAVGLDVPSLRGHGNKGLAKAIEEDADNAIYLRAKQAIKESIAAEKERFEVEKPDAVVPEGGGDDSFDTTRFAVKPTPGQRGLPGIKEDVAPPETKETPPKQASMFGGEMLQGVEKKVPEGREAEGPLFKQEEAAQAKADSKKQQSMFSTRAGERSAKPLTIDRIKTSIPGLEFTEKDGGFVAPLKNGGELRVNEVGEIEIRSPERLKESEEAAGQQGRPVGEYRSIGKNALINVAEGAPDGTVDHEGYHFIREFALSEKEREAASKKYGNEEAEAYAYAKWAQSRIATNSWFSKIMAYAKRLVHNFRPTWESTFEEVATGRAAQRIKGEAKETGESRYAVNPKNQVGPLGDDKIGLYEQGVDRMNSFKLMGERANAPENFTENPYNRLRTMNSRKSELERYVKEEVDEPIAKLLKDSKIPLEDAWKYMYAKHALDANPEYAKRTPGAHSGMSTVEAEKIIAKEKSKGRTKVLDQAQKEVNKLNDKVLDYGVETGLWTKKQVEGWKETWGDNWLALRHNVDVDGNPMPAPPAGGRSGLRGQEVKMREGATKEAFNPLVATLDRAVRVFRRGEENMVWKNFDGLLKKEPALKDVYEVVDKLPQEKALDRSGEYVGFKEGGEQKYLRFKNPDHVKVLASLNPPEADVIARTVQKVTRTMAALSTRWNPAFALLGNPIMDVTEALVNAKVEHGGKVAKDIAGGLGEAYRAARMGIKGKKPGSKADQALLDEFNEYRKNGGPMGNFSLLTLGEREAVMKHAVEGDNPAVASFKAVRDAIGKQGEVLEAMTRFAGYRAFKKAGMSPAKAIMASRDLTVDFERAGLLGHQIGRYYAFFNAGIQGTNKMVRVVRSNPKAAVKMIGGLIALGVANDQLNRAVWGDQDKDGINDWDQVPRYVKENHLMLGSKKVPLPRGWRFFNAMGVNLSQMANKTVSPETAAWNTVLSLNGLANPLGEGLGGKDTSKGLGIMATPTAAKPIAEVLLNQTALGGPVQPDQPKFGGKKPDSQLAFKNVNPIAKAIAEGLNRVTGGDKVTPGYVDWSPESIEQLFTSYSGGLGKTVSQVAGTGISVAQGKKPETRQVPIASRFLYEESPTQQANQFYTNKEELEEAKSKQKRYLDEYRKTRDAKLLPKIAEARKLTGAAGAFDAAERELKRLSEAKKAAEQRKADTAQIDASMKAAYTRANRTYNEQRKRSGLPAISASR